ncbi:hypothetical protein [Odoribacter lunatus]|uniref:hypothetical protein n=1 Tax=Odoribacter lunatus TaxID=2941335 RepID=UPI002040DD65|nr:hypothetical protein [Odoribacter lunatus]
MKTRIKRPTPLMKLHQKRQELRHKYKETRTLLSSDWEDIQEHSGSLLLSAINTLFFPRRYRRKQNPEEKNNTWQNIQDNLPFYLSIARESLSILWYIGRPFYLRWCMSGRKRNPATPPKS